MKDVHVHRVIETLEALPSGKLDKRLLKQLIGLLEELQERRVDDEQDRVSDIKKDVHRIFVEGYSTNSIQEAFADALSKTSQYYSKHHDVSVTIVSLLTLPKGGHRATLEVHLTKVTSRDTFEIENEDFSDEDKDPEITKEFHLKQIIQDHFMETTGRCAPNIPSYLLIDVADIEVWNKLIENHFFKAGHDLNVRRLDAAEEFRKTLKVILPK